MPIQITCPNPQCGKALRCPEEHAGKAVQCPTCGTQIQVPGGAEGKTQVLELGGYRLVRKLGEGGMGTVHEAIQIKLKRRVALKVISEKATGDETYLARFYREAQSAAALNHPNIIQVYDIAEDRGQHFFSMEFVDGESARDLLKREGRLALDRALAIAEGVARALQYAHQHGIIHRDIKPDNVMVTWEGAVKLADLGLAKRIADDSGVTQTGAGLGTPYYMAPEQAEDARSVDHRADIYALGITLLHLVTGRRPFDGESAYSIVIQHREKELPSARELGAVIPQEIETLIRKMCAKDPRQRYQDYDSLLADLERARTGAPLPIEAESTQETVPASGAGKTDTVLAPTGVEQLQEMATVPDTSRGDEHLGSAATQGLREKPTILDSGRSALGLARRRKRRAHRRGVLIWAACAVALTIALGYFVTRPKRPTPALPRKDEVRSIRPVSRHPAEPQETLEPEGEGPVPTADATAVLPPQFMKLFEIPAEPRDKYGNPVRTGLDEKTGLPLEIRHKVTGIHLVFVPAGEFMMGSPDDEKDRNNVGDEGPVHEVRLTKPFYLGKYEVTQAEWRAVMGRSFGRFPGERNPVEQVSWDDCQAFVSELNSEFRPPSSQLQFALPTEAQWEYACRAGTQTRFHYGDDLDYRELPLYAWFNGNAGGKTHPVGEKKPNVWGLYDMLGNAWEWCADQYGAYPNGAVSDPAGPERGDFRVLRGGGWNHNAAHCRSALRDKMVQRSRSGSHGTTGLLGFRFSLNLNLMERRTPGPHEVAATPEPAVAHFEAAKLPAFLAADFEAPAKPEDRHGNLVRAGNDQATGLPLEIRHKKTGTHLVLIPAGEFMMGSPASDRDRNPSVESPAHRVRLTKPFYLGKYETTRAEWRIVMGGRAQGPADDGRPMTGVSWDNCQEFAKKLNSGLLGPPEGGDAGKEGLEFALPTEAQWEYACRARATTRFYFGDGPGGRELSERAWFGLNSGDRPHAVGQKRPNAWGLYDMSGNACEWCEDWFGGYGGEAVSDPSGPEQGTRRIVRGGGWRETAADCRSAARRFDTPNGAYYGRAGCRIALTFVPALAREPIREGPKGGIPVSRPGPAIYTQWPFGPEEAKRRQEEAARGLGLPVEFDEDLGGGTELTLVLIPAGEFMMGSPPQEKGHQPAEGPAHRVRITQPFYLGKYEVTHEQWAAVMGGQGGQQQGELPVSNVSGLACQAFITKLTERLRKSEKESFFLATEAQWEYACRAGTETAYCFGNDESHLGDYAWFGANSGGAHHPVGQKKANVWGLHDMYGNMCELCLKVGNYTPEPQTDPVGTDEHGLIWRGGSAYTKHVAILQRSATRVGAARERGNKHLGFRIARKIRGVTARPAEPGLARYLGADFEVPEEPADTHGNAIRKGTDNGTGLPLEVRHKKTGMHLIFIPAGEFMMGSGPEEEGHCREEMPQHQVSIARPYYLGKYEVTQSEWQSVLPNSASRFKGEDLPVDAAAWNDFQEFIGKLNEELAAKGISPRFSLPSEAQWEYACRAGTTTPYYYGEDPDGKQLGNYEWYHENAGGKTHPVGRKKPNGWGLYDVCGNIPERVQDLWHPNYQGAPANGSSWSEAAQDKSGVSRGGSYGTFATCCRSAYRHWSSPPGTVWHLGGLRVCLNSITAVNWAQAGQVAAVQPAPAAAVEKAIEPEDGGKAAQREAQGPDVQGDPAGEQPLVPPARAEPPDRGREEVPPATAAEPPPPPVDKKQERHEQKPEPPEQLREMLIGEPEITRIDDAAVRAAKGKPPHPLKLNHHWARVWPAYYSVEFHSSATDNDGNVYLAGHLKGEFDFDPGPEEDIRTSRGEQAAFVTKLDQKGRYGWTHVLGGHEDDLAKAVAADGKGGVYVFGQFRGVIDFDPSEGSDPISGHLGRRHQLFLAKYDREGKYEWTRVLRATSGMTPQHLATDSSGNVYAVGEYLGDLDLGDDDKRVNPGRAADGFVAKYSPKGERLWVRTIAGPKFEGVRHVTAGKEGELYVCGVFNGEVDLDPTAGEDVRTPSAKLDNFLSAYSSDGTYRWTKTGVATSCAVLPSGGLVTLKRDETDYTTTVCVASYDPGGKERWKREITAKARVLWPPIGPLPDGQGNIYVAGCYNDDEAVDFDPGEGADQGPHFGTALHSMYVSRYRDDGTYQGTAFLCAKPKFITSDTRGTLFLAGSLRRSTDLDPGPAEDIQSAPNVRHFLLKWGGSPPQPGVDLENEKPAPVRKKARIVALGCEPPGRDVARPCAGILARELLRQAFLIAAREELGLGTRDQALREYDPKRPGPLHVYGMRTTISLGDRIELGIRPPGAEGTTLVRSRLSGKHELDYLKLIKEAAQWSEVLFPKLLRQQGLEAAHRAQDLDAVPATEEVEASMASLTLMSQYAALRELHRLVRAHGETIDLAGALARCYANLSVLSQHHWNASSKVFAARALLYVERALQQHGVTTQALLSRAYARALTGFHSAALADLKTAGSIRQGNRAFPRWTEVIGHFCRQDPRALLSHATRHPQTSELAHLLRCLVMASGYDKKQALEACAAALRVNPECWRLHAAACQLRTDRIRGLQSRLEKRYTETPQVVPSQVQEQRDAMQRAISLLANTLHKRLAELPDLPPSLSSLIKEPDAGLERRAAIVRALTEAGSPGLPDAQTDQRAQAEDSAAEDPSWALLARLIDETTFYQLCRKAHFLTKLAAVDADSFIQATGEVLAEHPYRYFLWRYYNILYSYPRPRPPEVRDWNGDSIVDVHWGMFELLVGNQWLFPGSDALKSSEEVAAEHSDPIAGDLVKAVSALRAPRNVLRARELIEVSPHSPLAYSTLIDRDWPNVKRHAAAWEERFQNSPIVLRSLAAKYLDDPIPAARQETALHRLVVRLDMVSPSPENWEILAKLYKARGDDEKWLEAMDRALKSSGPGLDRAVTLSEILEELVGREQWRRAEPYAREVARTEADWALASAVGCYSALGELERAEGTVKALSEKFWDCHRLTRHRHQYVWTNVLWWTWCMRTGKGDVDAARRAAGKETHGDLCYGLALVYLLDGNDKEAPRFMHGLAGHPSLDGTVLHSAMLAWRGGDLQSRDRLLQMATRAGSDGTDYAGCFARVAQAMSAALKAARPLDTKEVEQALDALGLRSEYRGGPWRDNVKAGRLDYTVGLFLALSGDVTRARGYMERAASLPLEETWLYVEPALAAQWLRKHPRSAEEDAEVLEAAKALVQGLEGEAAPLLNLEPGQLSEEDRDALLKLRARTFRSPPELGARGVEALRSLHRKITDALSAYARHEKAKRAEVDEAANVFAWELEKLAGPLLARKTGEMSEKDYQALLGLREKLKGAPAKPSWKQAQALKSLRRRVCIALERYRLLVLEKPPGFELADDMDADLGGRDQERAGAKTLEIELSTKTMDVKPIPAKVGTKYLSNRDYCFAVVPREVAGAQCIQRWSREAAIWLLDGKFVTVSRPCTLYVAVMCQVDKGVLVTEEQFAAFRNDGWALLDAPFGTTGAGDQVWNWKLMRREIPKGPVKLPNVGDLKICQLIFMFQ